MLRFNPYFKMKPIVSKLIFNIFFFITNLLFTLLTTIFLAQCKLNKLNKIKIQII